MDTSVTAISALIHHATRPKTNYGRFKIYIKSCHQENTNNKWYFMKNVVSKNSFPRGNFWVIKLLCILTRGIVPQVDVFIKSCKDMCPIYCTMFALCKRPMHCTVFRYFLKCEGPVLCRLSRYLECLYPIPEC